MKAIPSENNTCSRSKAPDYWARPECDIEQTGWELGAECRSLNIWK